MQWTGGRVHCIRIELSQRWRAVVQSHSLARWWWTGSRLSILIDRQTWSWCIRFLSENTLSCIRITNSFSFFFSILFAGYHLKFIGHQLYINFCLVSNQQQKIIGQIKWHCEWTSIFVTNSLMTSEGYVLPFLCTFASGYMHTISIMMVQVQLKMNQLASLYEFNPTRLRNWHASLALTSWASQNENLS